MPTPGPQDAHAATQMIAVNENMFVPYHGRSDDSGLGGEGVEPMDLGVVMNQVVINGGPGVAGV